MSLAVRHPEAVATAAGHLNGVGFALTAQNVAAATATVGLPPAIADEVSGLTATQFSAPAGRYGRERPSDRNPRDVHLDFGRRCYFQCGYPSRQHNRS
jgi:hypothetical protein